MTDPLILDAYNETVKQYQAAGLTVEAAHAQANKDMSQVTLNARMAEHSTMSDDDVDALVMGCQGACVGGKCND